MRRCRPPDGLATASRSCGSLLLVVPILTLLAPQVRGADARLSLDNARHTLLLKHDGLALPVSLKCPRLALDSETIGGGAPLAVNGDIASGDPVKVSYAPVAFRGGVANVELFLQWSPIAQVVRKWAVVRLGPGTPARLLKEVVLEDVDIDGAQTRLIPRQATFSAPMSYPIFFPGFFAGIEYPVASTRITKGHAVVAHTPGRRLCADVRYETRKAVYGFAPPGKEVRTFQDYIAASSPGARGRMFAWEP